VSATLNNEDVAAIEDAGYALLRHNETKLGVRILGLALLLRSQKVYACDGSDESAGMAEVADLTNYSKRVS